MNEMISYMFGGDAKTSAYATSIVEMASSRCTGMTKAYEKKAIRAPRLRSFCECAKRRMICRVKASMIFVESSHFVYRVSIGKVVPLRDRCFPFGPHGECDGVKR